MHLEVFHQAEVLWLDERAQLDSWQMTGRVLQSVDRLFPGRTFKIVPTQYQMCSQSWEIEVEDDGRWFEVLAWGVFSDRIVRHLGGDPERHIAVGVGYGLERLAMLRYGIDDIRTGRGGQRGVSWSALRVSDNLDARCPAAHPSHRQKRRYRAGFSEYSVRCRTSTPGRLTLISIVRRRLDGSVLVE